MNTGGNRQYEPRTFTHPKTGQPTTMNTANIGRRANSGDACDEDASLAATLPSPPRFDHEAAAIRNKAMDAIRALAEQPDPQDVIDAWMKFGGYGEPIETIEGALAWLRPFLERHREAEPRRWSAPARRSSAMSLNDIVGRVIELNDVRGTINTLPRTSKTRCRWCAMTMMRVTSLCGKRSRNA